jgi:hypothetical protein
MFNISRGLRIAIVALSLVSARQSLAEVQLIDNQDGWEPLLIFRGTISKADADYVTLQSEGKYKNKRLAVSLGSEGGNVAAAMAIGRIIRRNEWIVAVHQNWKCYSSCALIYIAGVSRVNVGEIGLHRPYFSESLDRQEIGRAAPIMLQKVREYVQSMGVTDSFYEQMVNTEPSEIRLYRGNEITNLVPDTDPTYDEIQNSYDARKYGVSAGEMRHRKSIAKQKCSFSDIADATEALHAIHECYQAVFWGLDIGTYRERNSKVSFCDIYKTEEYKTLE